MRQKKTSPLHVEADRLAILETGKLKDGRRYDIVLLGPENNVASYELHNLIIRNLADSEGAFLLGKSLDYFDNHLRPGNGHVIGIVVDHELAAQAVVHNPTRENPDTGPIDISLPCLPEQISMLQAVSVHPDYRGHGFMNRLVSHWVSIADSDDRLFLLSRIKTENVASWKSFLDNGLKIVSLGYDPDNGKPVYHACEVTETALARQLTGRFNPASEKAEIVCPLADLERQTQLFSDGYKAVGLAVGRQALVFQKLDL